MVDLQRCFKVKYIEKVFSFQGWRPPWDFQTYDRSCYFKLGLVFSVERTPLFFKNSSISLSNSDAKSLFL
jgi:hypothetical protein